MKDSLPYPAALEEINRLLSSAHPLSVGPRRLILLRGLVYFGAFELVVHCLQAGHWWLAVPCAEHMAWDGA